MNAYDQAYTILESLGDGLYVWATPEGRPDRDNQWQTAAANLTVWNQMLQILAQPALRTTLATQMPTEIGTSAIGIVEYWVGRLVGYALRPQAMQALVDDVMAPLGVIAALRSGGINNVETSLRRLTALIAALPEFAVR